MSHVLRRCSSRPQDTTSNRSFCPFVYAPCPLIPENCLPARACSESNPANAYGCLQKRARKPRAFKPGMNGLDTKSSLCAPVYEDNCSCFESSGAGRWPEARTQTNQPYAERSSFQSALSSTPECVGLKVWWTLYSSLSQDRKRTSQSRTSWMYPGEVSAVAVSCPTTDRVSVCHAESWWPAPAGELPPYL